VDECLLNHTFNENQIEWFKAGSALNLIAAEGRKTSVKVPKKKASVRKVKTKKAAAKKRSVKKALRKKSGSKGRVKKRNLRRRK
jgi:aconitate hydratase